MGRAVGHTRARGGGGEGGPEEGSASERRFTTTLRTHEGSGERERERERERGGCLQTEGQTEGQQQLVSATDAPDILALKGTGGAARRSVRADREAPKKSRGKKMNRKYGEEEEEEWDGKDVTLIKIDVL